MKKFSRLSALLMVLVMAFAMAAPIYADGSVTYDGDANKFIFAPGSDESPTNLFENFQNVMPGDTLTEQIVVKNTTSNGVYINLYMRALGAQEDTDEILSLMNLTVKQKDDSVLFDAPADETAQLTDWVYLGSIHSGGEMTLDLTLEVPITMGDEFQNQAGYLDWEFKVEEVPVSLDPKPPQTGDTFEVFLYGGIVLLSLGLIIFLVFFKRKKRSCEE